jgi:hypothetical protein
MNREQELAELRARVESLEWRLESAFGPGGESHPVELWNDLAALRVAVEAIGSRLRAAEEKLRISEEGGGSSRSLN